MSFFEELRRRNVFRVGAAYAVVAWLLIQVADVLLPRLGAPEWFVNALMLVILLGFPVALVISWIFEVTPDGITTQDAVDAGAQTTSGKKLNAVIIGGMALAIVFLVVDNYILDDADLTEPVAASTGSPVDEILDTAGLEKSIAVLPFANLSSDPEQEYFSDGLTDELINKLSQVRDLEVTGRSSSFYFKDRDDALDDIGRQLGVAYLLQGSVRKAGSQVRITAQLMDVASNSNLWSDTYDETLEDIFIIQDEIAASVAQALSITLRAGMFSDPGMTGNVEAYDAYLQGIKLYGDTLNGEGSFLDAMAQLEKAVALDPGFGIAWQNIAQGYLTYNLGNINLPPSERAEFPARGQQALERAVALIPEHPRMRMVALARDTRRTSDPLAWENDVRAMIDAGGSTEINALLIYTFHLWPVGRVQEAVRLAERVTRLDPLVFEGQWVKIALLVNQGRLDDAKESLDKVMATGQGTMNLQGLRFLMALQEGDLDAAVQAVNDFPNFGQTTHDLANAYTTQGAEGTLAMIRRLIDAGNVPPVLHPIMRELAAALDEPELALEILQLQGGTPGDQWLPLYSDMRALPGFKDWLRERGHVDYWRATGWNDFCGPIEGTESDFECH